MRRRPKEPAESDEPQHLRLYNPADWPNPECHPECAFWAAREAWSDAHPFDPGDPAGTWSVVAEGPDVPWHPEWV